MKLLLQCEQVELNDLARASQIIACYLSTRGTMGTLQMLLWRHPEYHFAVAWEFRATILSELRSLSKPGGRLVASLHGCT